MIVMVLIRLSNVHEPDFQVWANFWLQIEGCTAVLTVSLTAFRTIFVSDHSNAGKEKHSPAFPSRRFLWLRGDQGTGEQNKARAFATIPSAKLTGMRTLIRGAGRESMLATGHTDETDNGTIQEIHTMSADSESVSETADRYSTHFINQVRHRDMRDHRSRTMFEIVQQNTPNIDSLNWWGGQCVRSNNHLDGVSWSELWSSQSCVPLESGWGSSIR